LLPRVPNALGEGAKTLGEAFPECNTRGRASGDASHGEEVFPECQKSYTRGRCNAVGVVRFFFGKPLPQVQHSGKKFVFLFNPLPRVRIFSFFEPSSPSAPSQALGEEISWILFLKALPRVPLPRHLGKPLFCFSV
jgi:hypothetical protein